MSTCTGPMDDGSCTRTEAHDGPCTPPIRQTSRTKYGLTLIKTTYQDSQTDWETGDGSYTIGRTRAVEYCDAPHPIKITPAMVVHARENWHLPFSQEVTDAVRQGKRGLWCQGEEPHDREVGWDIRPTPASLNDDLYPSLDDAWRHLAQAVPS